MTRSPHTAGSYCIRQCGYAWELLSAIKCSHLSAWLQTPPELDALDALFADKHRALSLEGPGVPAWEPSCKQGGVLRRGGHCPLREPSCLSSLWSTTVNRSNNATLAHALPQGLPYGGNKLGVWSWAHPPSLETCFKTKLFLQRTCYLVFFLPLTPL